MSDANSIRLFKYNPPNGTKNSKFIKNELYMNISVKDRNHIIPWIINYKEFRNTREDCSLRCIMGVDCIKLFLTRAFNYGLK